MVAKQGVVRGCMEKEVGVNRRKPLYTESINNKILLYSTENYIQYPKINNKGREYKKGFIYL